MNETELKTLIKSLTEEQLLALLAICKKLQEEEAQCNI